MRIVGIIHRENAIYGISFPDLPGCVSAADSLLEILDMGAEALSLHLEGMLDDGDPIPELRPLSQLEADPEFAEDFAAAEMAFHYAVAFRGKAVTVTYDRRGLIAFGKEETPARLKKAPEPHPDNRHRVHQSTLVYGLNAYFIGRSFTLSFQESAERVVHRQHGGKEFVVFDNQFRELRPKEETQTLAQMAMEKRLGSLRIKGVEITDIGQFTAYPYFFLLYDFSKKEERRAVEQKILRMLRRYEKAQLKFNHLSE